MTTSNVEAFHRLADPPPPQALRLALVVDATVTGARAGSVSPSPRGRA